MSVLGSAAILPSFSQFIKEMEIGIFEKARLRLQSFANSINCLKTHTLVTLPSYFFKWRGWSFIRHVASEKRS